MNKQTPFKIDSGGAAKKNVAAAARSPVPPETQGNGLSARDVPGAAATKTTNKWCRECAETKRMRALQQEQAMQAHQRALDLQGQMDRRLGPFDTIVPDLRDMTWPDHEAVVLDMRGPMETAMEYQRKLQEAGKKVASETTAAVATNI